MLAALWTVASKIRGNDDSGVSMSAPSTTMRIRPVPPSPEAGVSIQLSSSGVPAWSDASPSAYEAIAMHSVLRTSANP